MRKIILLISMLLTLGSATYAQSLSTDTFSLAKSNLPSVGAVFNVPVKIASFPTSNLRYIEVCFRYDTTVLRWVGNTNLQGTGYKISNTSTTPGSLKFNFNNSLTYINVVDGKLFDMQFKYLGGNTNLTYDITTTGFRCRYSIGTVVFITNATNASLIGSGYVNNTIAGGAWADDTSWSAGVKPNSWHNITVASTSEVTASVNALAHDVTINNGGKLTVNSGKTLAVAGAFTIKDGGSYINNGVGANTATVERTIPSDNSWHFISSPVDGALIQPSFAPNEYSTTFDFYKWDEATSQAVGYFPWINIRPPTGSTYASGFVNFEIARGYLVAYSSGWNSTHSFVGTLGNGNKTITITNSMNTYNLIGNPYPSAINWDNIAAINSSLLGVSPYIRIWNSTAGQYATYQNGLGLSGASNIIAPNQGFFVQAIASGILTIPNAARVHGTQAFLKSTPADLLKLKVSSSANTYTDEMIVRFDANATSDGVTKWNSLIATAPSLYSVKNDENYTINTLTAVNSNLVVPVGFKAGANGMYSITASELNSFSTPTYVYLEDLANNTITDLNSTAMYSFAANTTDNADRFQLIFALSPLSISNNVKENTNIYSYDNTIYINSNESIKQIDVYNTLGQLIKTFENKSGSVVVNMNGNSEGYYIVKVITNTNVYSQKVLVK